LKIDNRSAGGDIAHAALPTTRGEGKKH